jgi:hypothetical protein
MSVAKCCSYFRSVGKPCAVGGLLMGPSIVRLHMKSDKTVPGFAPAICNRLYKARRALATLVGQLKLTWDRQHCFV